MKISVVIPCYNEEQTVLQIVKMVQGVLVDNEYEISSLMIYLHIIRKKLLIV